MDLYFAGEYSFGSIDLNFLGYNRLCSADYQKKTIDKTIEVLKKQKEDKMDLYLVGPEKKNIMEIVVEELKSNVLFSYETKKREAEIYTKLIAPGKLFIDSGAFSSWTKGKVINVDDYIDWINERADFIDLYGQVDSIPGDRFKGHTQEQVEAAAEATWQNYLYMRPKMKNPDGLLYTFHVEEPYHYLKQALEWKDENGNQIPYIALGGMVSKSTTVKLAFLDSCERIIKNSTNPTIKVHAFGMTSFKILANYPWITSADSTSWIMVGANGGIMTDVGTIIVSDRQANLPEHYSHLPHQLREEFEKSLEEFGVTLEELRHCRDKRIILNARYMHKRAKGLQYITPIKKKSLF